MRLGAVPYLNTLPLIRYLSKSLTIAPPAALDRLLKLGEIDLATAPITTLFERPTFRLVPGIGIGTRGKIKSVRLVIRKAGQTLPELSSIFLDMESRTSVALLKVLLHFKYKRDLSQIRFVSPIPTPDVEAALLIGDKALRSNDEVWVDLGEEWTAWTGLPFVFAAWIGTAASLPTGLIAELKASRDRALANIDEAIRGVPGISTEEARRYLLENCSYNLGDEEIEGVKKFHSYGKALGLFTNEFRLPFYTE